MATSEMVTSYPTWVKVRWGSTETFAAADVLFDNIVDLRKETNASTAPTWTGPSSSTTYVTALNNALSELLAIDATVLWDQMLAKYPVMAHIGTINQTVYSDYVSAETEQNKFVTALAGVNKDSFMHPISKEGTALYDKLMADEAALLDDIDDQLQIINDGVKEGLVNVYGKAFEQHLNKGTLWSSFCYNWILERYDQVIGANREYTNKVVIELRDKHLDRVARLIEVSGQTHGQGSQLGLTHDKMVGDFKDNKATRRGRVLELSAQSYEKGNALKHDVAGKVLSSKLQVEELQSKLKSTVTQWQYQVDNEIAKSVYAALITTKKWKLDLSKYSIEAMASLQGASPLSKSSSETGWAAMSSTEKALSLASVGVSAASGITSVLKDLKIF